MTFEFNNDGLGAAMELINAGIEVKENKENLERIKNEIKTTKLKLVRDRIGMVASCAGAMASTAVTFTDLNIKTILCCVLSGICLTGSWLFAYDSTNKKDKLSNLHDEEEEALDKRESLAKAYDDATIKYHNLAGDKYYDLYLSMAESTTYSFDGVKK